MKQKFKLMLGDNIESLKKIPDNSIDSVVTDPPYGLSFMNKKWDYDVPSVQFWKEVYRVLKPGGHIVSFGGTRTYHRMVVNIEDAGFEIRDQIMWLYGSGFPKSRNIGKDIEKINVGGINNLKQVGTKKGTVATNHHELAKKDKPKGFSYKTASHSISHSEVATARTQTTGDIPVYEINNEYEGWGTALKPSNEPICLARKPLSEKSVAENVLKWKTGGINVDGCRIGSDEIKINGGGRKYEDGFNGGWNNISKDNIVNEGRFPANIILECICDEVIKGEKGEKTTIQTNINNKDANWFRNAGGDKEDRWSFNDKGDIHTNPDCPCRLLDEQSGFLKSGDGKSGKHKINRNGNTDGVCKMDMGKSNEAIHYGDSGGASRFFYQAKVSKAERNMGLDGFEIKINIGTIKLLIYKRKNEIVWERQDLNQTHQVDMEQSQQKDTEGFITKEECVWNTELFGNYIMERFQKDIKSITEMKTNSITIYQTLNSLIQQSTNEYIVTQQKELMDGIKFVESADKKNTKAIITYQKKDGLNQSVNPASLREVWSISVEEEVKSNHPTMKPVNLMTYLCRLITPENGIVLDPFMGSGSTGIAAQLEGFRFVGMEMDEEYMKIATARIENYEKYKKFIK